MKIKGNYDIENDFKIDFNDDKSTLVGQKNLPYLPQNYYPFAWYFTWKMQNPSPSFLGIQSKQMLFSGY